MFWNLLKQVLGQYKKWKFVPATKNILYHWVGREQKKSFGNKNPDKTFYVIRSVDCDSKLYIGARLNLMANYFYVVSHLFYAEKRGWIPIIDEKNYPVYNSIDKPINGSYNAWEYYFVQPSPYSLEEVYQSKHVILSKRSWFGEYDMGYDPNQYSDPTIIEMFSKIADRIPLNEPTINVVEKIYKEYFNPKEKVLGVSYRYGGHAKDCYYQGDGHPMQLEAEELLEMAVQLMREWKMQKIFLTSDEQTIVEVFKKHFEDKIIVLPRKRRKRGEETNLTRYKQLYAAENIHETTLGYLVEMELLSRCNALVGTITSGIRYAVIRNNMKYEHCKIVDNGLLPNSKKR